MENVERNGDCSAISLRPAALYQPLHNSIPEELLGRFDPVYVEYYNKYNAGRLHTHEVPIEAYRKNPAKYTIAYGRAAGPDVYRITEQKCPVEGGEITVRIFKPAPAQDVDADGKPKQRAAYINFHGGGWVFGDLSKDHDICKRIVDAMEGDLVAFDVDYRLAPEHRYPIPVDDCWAAFNWVSTFLLPRDYVDEISRSELKKAKEFNLDPKRLAVGEISAGGHLAAVVGQLCRNANIPLAFQLLCVPVCDLHSVFTPEGEFDRENCPYESYQEMEFTPALPTARMAYFHRHFLGNPRPSKSENNWKISPNLSTDFSNLAPALIFTAELDPLRDEGRSKLIRVPGVPHTFAHLDGILDAGKMYNEKVIEELKIHLRV
ncbi:hypothetical protein VTN77DRAFT_5481 [Rasamsonia byssochlamydoides]|uniref:uncharacterized protein n=1 Tax=Rasamsonia byssochlamydoides TaxID=89139 RepID=UPI0037437074